jgi:phosphoenolpyruvate synthase/pyruvate phosphate dikinase
VDLVLALDHCDAGVASRVGGKALGLGSLLREGLRVPPGFVVTTDAYREGIVLPGLHAEIVRMLEGTHSIEAQHRASDRIRAIFERTELAEQVGSEIAIAYRRLAGGRAEPPVAVRSSATAEDRADTSFAGQQETYLWVRGEAAVARAVMRCWGSLFTPQAIAYRAHFGVPVEGLAMAVVVQEMVSAEAAGVMITLDPVNGDRSAITIESSFGLGLAVVGGEVTPDRFVVDKVTFDIRTRSIGPKAIAYRFDAESGAVVPTDVPQDDQRLPSLGDEEVVELARIGRALERAQGGPQDVEWAIGPGPDRPRQVFLLQMRPETVWSRRTVAPISDPNTPILARMLRSMSVPMRIRDSAPVDPDGAPDQFSG